MTYSRHSSPEATIAISKWGASTESLSLMKSLISGSSSTISSLTGSMDESYNIAPLQSIIS